MCMYICMYIYVYIYIYIYICIHIMMYMYTDTYVDIQIHTSMCICTHVFVRSTHFSKHFASGDVAKINNERGLGLIVHFPLGYVAEINIQLS